MVRVGSYSLCLASFERLVAWHGAPALGLPAPRPGRTTVRDLAVGWALRQAVLRGLAAPPRLSGRWTDIRVRGCAGGPYTIAFRGELAAYADAVLRGDINLSVTDGQGFLTACAVLTRRGPTPGRLRAAIPLHPEPAHSDPTHALPSGPPPDDETEVRR